MMPVMGGLQMVRELRKKSPLLKIIATTGLIHENKSQEFARLKVPDVLLKPYEPFDLLQTVHRNLQLC